MRRWRLAVACGALLLNACMSSSHVPAATYTQSASVADSNGWYKFRTYWFKGSLRNNVPDGVGDCRTEYATPDSDKTEWITALCEFKAGVRVDAYHQARAEASLARARDVRARELESQREDEQAKRAGEAYQRAEREEGRKAFNAAMAGEIARIPAQMNAQMARLEAASRGSSVEEDQAKAHRAAEFNAVIAKMEADPDSDLNRNKRARAREKAEEKRRDAERTAKVDASKQAAAVNENKRSSEAQDREKVEAAAQKRQEADALRAQQDRERQRLESEQRAKEIRDDIERKRLAGLEEARKRAEKETEARAEIERKSDYLRAMERGIKLGARHCPDGKGAHYIVGIRPRLKPELVSCVDVHYTEICPGSAVGTSGVAKNFLGEATDCFMGDAAQVSPTPACKPNQARVVVDRVTACGG